MTKNDVQHLTNVIESEGYAYCFLEYSNFDYIKDKDFHELRKAFVDASENLKKYLTSQGVEVLD